MKFVNSTISLLLAVSAGAVEIDISPSKSPIASQTEVSVFVSDVKKREHVVLDDDVAKSVVENNRLLADAYLKEVGIKATDLQKFRFGIEKQLAADLVTKYQEKIKTDEDVLKSYYVTHLDEFKIGNEITFKAYTYDAYADALNMYEHFSASNEGLETYAKDHNATIQFREHFPVGNLDNALKYLLEEERETPYLTVPTRYREKYILLIVQQHETDVLLPYEKVKHEIRQKLLREVRNRSRDALIEKYRGSEQQ